MEAYLHTCTSLEREASLITRKMESLARQNADYRPIMSCYEDIASKLNRVKRFNWKKHCNLARKLDSARKAISTNAGSDIQQIRSSIFAFENELSAYKESMANEYITLCEQSDLFSEEASNLDSLLSAHETISTDGKHMTRAVTERIKERNEEIEAHQQKIGVLNKKIKAVEQKNTWDTYEHDMLLRAWAQCAVDVPLTKATQHKLIKKLSPLLPHKSVDELLNHVFWYEELQTAVQEKKQLISDWKESRFHNKVSQVDEIAEEVVPALSPADRSNSANNEEAKEKIHQWRETRARELAMQKEHNEQQRKEQEAREKIKKQRKNKQLLQQWKESKAQNSSISPTDESINSDTHKSHKTDARDLRERHEKDLQKVQQRTKAIEDMARRKNRDTAIKDRILDATHAHKTRAISSEERVANEKIRRNMAGHDARIPMSGYDLRLGGRAAPMWTKGVRL